MAQKKRYMENNEFGTIKNCTKYNNGPEIIQEIKVARVRWQKHVLRTDDLYPCRKLTSKIWAVQTT